MTTPRYNVVRLESWMDPAYDRILRDVPSISLQICAIKGRDEVLERALSQVHVLQTNSARDELPPH
jgi:hypothetical protein